MINEDSIYTQLHEYYFYDCSFIRDKGYSAYEVFENNTSRLFISNQYHYISEIDSRYIISENYPDDYEETINMYYGGNCDGYNPKITEVVWVK